MLLGEFMNASICCNANEIIELNNCKEYTLTATPLLDLLLNDPNLTAQSSKLWQLLYNKARFNSEFKIKISYGFLGKRLNKSTRTIQRYVTTLVNFGYLVKAKNYRDNGGQTTNTIFVRFPEHKISLAKLAKDRVSTAQAIKLEESEPNNFLPIEKIENVSTHPQPLINAKQPTVSIESDKDVVPPHDIAVVHYNNIKINNNNNNVVSSSRFENAQITKTKIATNNPENNSHDIEKTELSVKEQIEIYKLQLAQVTAQYEAAKQDFNQETSNAYKTSDPNETNCFSLSKPHKIDDKYRNNIFEKMQIMNSLDSQKIYFENKVEYLTKILAKEQNKNNLQDKITNDPYFIANKPGKRKIDTSMFLRIYNKLSACGIDNSNKNRLMNEILFECRFGSLVKSNITKQEMSLENSLNIAVKLFKENRWSTPSLMQQQLQTLV